MRQKLINASKLNYQANIEKHRINVEVMLNNPTAIHEHSDIMEAIEREIAKMADYKDKLEIIEKYFVTSRDDIVLDSSYPDGDEYWWESSGQSKT